jgi:surface protein
MQSLTELNSRSRVILEVPDQRASGVVLDRLPSAIKEQRVTATTSTVVKNAVEILEVINYATANVRYKITIVTPEPALTGSSISWLEVPGGITLDVSGNVYMLSGIKTSIEWDLVKNPIWVLPSNFATKPLWYLNVELIWYDNDLEQDVSVSWFVYDPRFYYISRINTTSSLNINETLFKDMRCNMVSNTLLELKVGAVLNVDATLSVVATNIKQTNVSLTAFNNAVINVSVLEPISLSYTFIDPQTISMDLLGVTNAKVFWGDGSVETFTTSGTKTHTYASGGTYIVEIAGTLTGWRNNSFSFLRRVRSFGTVGLTSLAGALRSTTALLEIPAVLPSTVTNLSTLFSGCTANLPEVSGWNVSNVTNMSGMFGGSGFNQPLNSWNVSNVTDMSSMFVGSLVFNQQLNNWNTQNVTNMSRMFNMSGTSKHPFNQPIGNWNTSNVTDMSSMFQGGVFNQPIGNWNVSKVTSFFNMFEFNFVFNQPLTNWNTIGATTMANMFRNARAFNQPLSHFNTSNVINMSGMFAGLVDGNTKFNYPIGNWNTSKVTDMRTMFFYNSIFDQNISGWCVSNIPTKPQNFDFGTSPTWTTAEKPGWGTCP